MSYEECKVCGAETGNAGAGDDSIFCLSCDKGPLCSDCHVDGLCAGCHHETPRPEEGP